MGNNRRGLVVVFVLGVFAVAAMVVWLIGRDGGSDAGPSTTTTTQADAPPETDSTGLADILDQAPEGDADAVAAYLETPPGTAVTDAVEGARSEGARTCTSMNDAAAAIVARPFVAGAGGLPDPYLNEAALTVHSAASSIRLACDRNGDPAPGLALLDTAMALYDARLEQLGVTP